MIVLSEHEKQETGIIYQRETKEFCVIQIKMDVNNQCSQLKCCKNKLKNNYNFNYVRILKTIFINNTYYNKRKSGYLQLLFPQFQSRLDF